ncbi:alpha/beta hydrolase [Catelliglobosispora koreensis]|uniref:alpha/beta hydrolase n=1 Tax=Catelliglobosispora koreensis TaxID=129052 RepID=UPI000375E8BB|nr:alpha/beta hydrolase [Catelliglobosispora koreensis]
MLRLPSRVVKALSLAVAVVSTASACCIPPVLNGGQAKEASPEPGWSSCTEEARKVLGRVPENYSFQCRTVQVPQDWNNPGNGATMNISVVRARAGDQRDRIGSLLVNPGGPGGSGVDLAMFLTRGLPAEITRRFDIVGFDPRGVGRSDPIQCYSASDLDALFAADPDPATQADYDEVVALNKKMADACAAKYGPRLSLFSTEQAARDMDQIRKEVGDEKLTYLGYSYGTLLGATYAQLFPDKIRALVLDGAVDPTLDSQSSAEGQAKGFELAFSNFATWCTTNRGRCPVSGDAEAVVLKVMEQAREKAQVNRDGRRATPGWILWGVVSAMYSKASWPELGEALADLEDGNPAGIFALADDYARRDASGEYTNLFDANSAVNCADDGKPASLTQIRGLQAQWREQYPVFGTALAMGMLTCSVWPAARDPYPAGAAQGAPPILVVGTKGDPATPYEQTPKLAAMLGVGVVLTWNGEGHTAYPETSCITGIVNKYLVNLEVPKAGTTCPA